MSWLPLIIFGAVLATGATICLIAQRCDGGGHRLDADRRAQRRANWPR